MNGRELADFLDWEFLTADDELVIEARLPDGEAIVYEIERPEGESMGVELEPPTIRRCANRCEFCFIEGLPKGLREAALRPRRRLPPLVRLRQLRDALEREGARHRAHSRVSPVAALHLGARHAVGSAQGAAEQPATYRTSSSSSRKLAAGGIQFHGQMVIVPGLNDGDVLEQSFADLWTLGDAVPLGRDRSRRADAVLASLHRQVDGSRERAKRCSTRSSDGRRASRDERGHSWVYGSDELYLLAERAAA